MKSKAESSVDVFNNGFNCAQAVLTSHCQEYGLSDEMAKKIAGGFGAGMGYNSEVCGAVTGALMLIGLKYGKFRESDNEAKAKTYKLVTQFTDAFKKEHGTIICKELIKYDMRKEDELQKAHESGVFDKVCPLLVKSAVELVEGIL